MGFVPYQFPGLRDKVGVAVDGIAPSFCHCGKMLTWRTGMDKVKFRTMFLAIFQRICLDKRKRIPFLGIYIHANNLAVNTGILARLVITHCRTARTTKHI